MTENRRIFLNIAATFGRSLFAFACGVFGGRWALKSLGTVDYGLQGVVGGLTIFIGFLNGVLASSMQRFYALTVGKARRADSSAEGLEESRRWFSIAVFVHTLVPMLLLAIGWPIGEWAVRSFLTIPPDRVGDCLWVFRFSCIGCFVGMVTVPFYAMYVARQYIAELTIYGFVTSSLNIGMLYYMVTHPQVWLVKYSLWLTIVSVLPSLIIAMRSLRLFAECRFRLDYCFDFPRLRQLVSYSFWLLLSSVSDLLRGQGMAVLVNKYFGPGVNAALSISGNVNGKANALSASMNGAFTPAIVSAYGAGDMDRARGLSLRICKFGVLASLVFLVPVAIELPYVMRLWLDEPPEFVCCFCWAIMGQQLITRTTKGHLILIQATGRIGVYELVVAGLSLLMLPVAWCLMACGVGPVSVCYALVGVTILYAWLRPFFAKRLAGLSIRHWVFGVMLPLALVLILSLLAGAVVRVLLPEGFLRLVVSAFVCESTMLPLSWWLLFDGEERAYVVERLRKILSGRSST